MDTETKELEAKQNPFQRLPRRTQYLLAALGIAVILAGAYFIGASSYYRVNPLEMVPQEEAGTPYGSEEFAAGYQELLRLFDLATTVTCVGYTERSEYADVIENEWYIDRSDPAICKALASAGKVSLTQIVYLGEYPYGGRVGAGLFSAGGKQYLVSFSLGDGNREENALVVLRMAELKDVRTVMALSVVSPDESHGLIRLTGTDADAVPFERYLTIYKARYDLTFENPAYKNADRSFAQRVTSRSSRYGPTYPVSVSFLFPSLDFVVQGEGDRNAQLETETGVSPLYHRQICGKEETYADLSFDAYIKSPLSEGNVQVLVQTGAYPLLNITTPMSGYIPEDWGKVLAQLTPEIFREQVRAPNLRNAQVPSEILTIEGHPVKFTGPYKGIGQCKDNYAGVSEYQYQTVSDASVISFLFTAYPPGDMRTEAFLSEKEREAIIAEVLRTLSIKPR